MPTCGKCGDTVFMTAPAVLVGASKSAVYVFCRNCHTVVGVVDSEEINKKLEHVANGLKAIANKLGVLLP